MQVTKADIQSLSPRPTKAGLKQRIWDWYADAFEQFSAALLAEFGIDEPPELHDFMAHVAHESGGFTIVEEDLNYTTLERLMDIFGGKWVIDKTGQKVWRWNHSARITPEEGAQLLGKPEPLGERAYGLGNPSKAVELGNTEPGDGWKYRGWGAMQITGKSDHVKYFGGRYDGESMIRAALMEYTAKGCPKYAMACDIVKTTKLINGDKNGLDDRKRLLAKAQAIWSTQATEQTDGVAMPPFTAALTSDAPPPKTVYDSNTMRATTLSNTTGGFVAVKQVQSGITDATANGGWDWFAFLNATLFNEMFWAGLVIIVSGLLIWRERWLKGDLSFSKKPLTEGQK